METTLIGVSENINRARELIDHVADTGLNILICGESGVGKEVVAHNLYKKSPRCDKPFIKINCAAMPDGLLESELFGYEQGAFTGAERKKRGKFELANGGILFLDEIGDMSLHLQAKLLHVLQSGEFSPLGSESELKTDTWVLAATNHDLENDIAEGKFREDLYYRLNIIKINITPIRHRPEDIPPLVEYFIKKYAPRYNSSYLTEPQEELINKLQNYRWPGNVRELQNVLKRIMVLGHSEEIVDELKSNRFTANSSGSETTNPFRASGTSQLLDLEGRDSPDNESFSLKEIRKRTLDRVEREVITHVLKKTEWNRSKASKILKISYKTLLYKITDLNIQK